MKKLIILLVVLCFLFLSAGATSQAQQVITASPTATVEFPEKLTFCLNTTGDNNITRIFLNYRIDKIETARVTSVVQVDFDPAPEVDVCWTWDMKKMLGSLPPGTVVEYSWSICNVKGECIQIPWNTVRFDDARHSWSSISCDDITLRWYKGERNFAAELLDVACDYINEFAVNNGVSLEQDIQIYVYDGSTALRDAMLYPQEWVGGVAFTEYATVAIGVGQNELEYGKRILAHEIAHLVVHQLTYNPYGDIPTWLDEGLAMLAEGDLRFDLATALSDAIEDDDLLSLQTLSGSFPVNYMEALLSYAQSYSVARFLIEGYGNKKMLELLGVFKHGSTCDDALLKVYGLNTMSLEDSWRFSLGLEPRQTPSDGPEDEVPTPTPTGKPGLFGCRHSSVRTGYDFLITGVFGMLFATCVTGILIISLRRR